ncbi:hypothetical protein IT41_07475 [Paracoccus halophilus]|uniref:Uncharacterized protein n=1 Tax=Paracoccus halophilus TaxID=376733 RepID=A0A099F3E4_9RHOB|nr:hypothetical protein IT41_07475 [Paracoccus halophilus]
MWTCQYLPCAGKASDALVAKREPSPKIGHSRNTTQLQIIKDQPVQDRHCILGERRVVVEEAGQGNVASRITSNHQIIPAFERQAQLLRHGVVVPERRRSSGQQHANQDQTRLHHHAAVDISHSFPGFDGRKRASAIGTFVPLSLSAIRGYGSGLSQR